MGNNIRNIYNSRSLLRISLLLNVVALLAIAVFVARHQALVLAKIENVFTAKQPVKILLLGDSRIADGDWETGLHRRDVKNGGVVNVLTSGFLFRLNTDVLQFNPKICILQIGINDIRNKVSIDSSEVYYKKILDTLIFHNIKPVVTSIIPLRKDFWQDEVNETDANIKTDSLNRKLIAICQFRHIPYLDVNRYLTENNRLKRELTHDGIHLNAFGFEFFYNEINNYLKKNNE